MINVGSKTIKGLYHGANAVSKVYRGDKLVWSMSILPPGYTPCKYLESYNAQYIRTDYTPVIGDEMSATFELIKDGTHTIFSAGTGDYQFIALQQGSILYFKYFTTGGASQIRLLPGVHSVRFSSNGGFYIDKSYVGTEISKNKSDVNTSIYLFRRANDASQATIRIYSFDIFGKMHLVPCLDTTGKPCMYDTVSGKSYYNNGTGEFLYELEE